MYFKYTKMLFKDFVSIYVERLEEKGDEQF